MKRYGYNVYHALSTFLLTLVFSVGLFTSANAQEDYGDLLYLDRDASGVPTRDGNNCRQPIAFPSQEGCTLVCASEPCLIPLQSDEELYCELQTEFAACAKEVEFGRVNVGRAPEVIFERQLEDVATNLNTADCQTLDPAGRMAAIRVDEDLGTTLTSTIDSPLQNLAIYRQLILGEPLGFPIPQGASVMDTAARGFGAAFGKGDEVDVDKVVYANQIMGLSDKGTNTILDPQICQFYAEEVTGVMQLVEHCFLDYNSYSYTRATNFSSLPAPAYMPADPTPQNGVFEYLTVYQETPLVLFGISVGPILDAVFCVDSSSDPIKLDHADDGVCPDTIATGFVGSNVGAFTQAVDDTRAVISFMHSNQVPEDYVTPVPCDVSSAFFVLPTPDKKAAVFEL